MDIVCLRENLKKLIPDRFWLQYLFKRAMGYPLDLKAPATYNEKLNWLKLYDRNPKYIKMVDKYEAKKWAAGIIGEDHIITTYGIWNCFDDINFDTLPSKFVLKCTHDSGTVKIIRNKADMDLIKLKDYFNERMSRNHYWNAREWSYKFIKPRILAEKYVEDEITKELRDYKFFCFDGNVKFLFIASDRQKPNEDVKFDFFDKDFNHMTLRQGHPNSKILPEKPPHFEEMKILASKLSKDIPHVRIDLYEANGHIYFGEMTFYHFGGIVPFVPEKWDLEFGKMINLPQRKRT